MVQRIETYKDMDIDRVEDAPINNILNSKVIYHACKLWFSEPSNYLDIYGKTLEECKSNIDKNRNGIYR